ncbi:MAG TPA: galactose oxidase early set domain-containing protein [Planctomycetota bacterium]|nr:galactose oxidase early set domain-containing protein [Planctomycetota bacterium]
MDSRQHRAAMQDKGQLRSGRSSLEIRALSLWRSRVTSAAALLLALLGGMSSGPSAAAQVADWCMTSPPPAEAWSGPFGPFQAMESAGVQEIAHAIVLPPTQADPDKARVLFICRSNCDDDADPQTPCDSYPQTTNLSFVWKPTRPGAVVEVATPEPPGVQPGAADLFCSGHAPNRLGEPIAVGGVNYDQHCDPSYPCIGAACDDTAPPVGHKYAYKLTVSTDPPTWSLLPGSGAPALFAEHWYGTVITMPDAKLLVAGHAGNPSPACPMGYSPWPYADPSGNNLVIDQWYETLDPVLGTSAGVRNLTWPSTDCSVDGTEIHFSDYPRLHVLGTGQLAFPIAPTTATTVTTRLAWLVDSKKPCPPNMRWETSSGWQGGGLPPPLPSSDGAARDRKGSSSVHYVLLDASCPTGTRDILYQFGGNRTSDDEPTCAPDETTNRVWRLKYDVATSLSPCDDAGGWSWDEVASMNHKRVNHNAVLMPTGETFIPGGVNDGCGPVLQPERFRPSEIFGGAAGGQWVVGAPHTLPFLYHSVAGLLPDGRVFVAGGNASHSYHKAEIYAPAYYFNGARPDITSWPSPFPPTLPIQYGSTFSIDTAVCGGANSVQRVVLIRSGSTTHGFDMNQRYVELAFGVQSGTSPYFTLNVTAPRDGYVAPPGYYLLFIIDALGLPSEGKWVRVDE